MWQELERDPSPYAVAQLCHALHATLVALAGLTGANAPTNRVAEAEARRRAEEIVTEGCERLSAEEFGALCLLKSKMEGEVPPQQDVLAEIIKRYRAGTLVVGGEILEASEGLGEENGP